MGKGRFITEVNRIDEVTVGHISSHEKDNFPIGGCFFDSELASTRNTSS